MPGAKRVGEGQEETGLDRKGGWRGLATTGLGKGLYVKRLSGPQRLPGAPGRELEYLNGGGAEAGFHCVKRVH